MSFSRRGIFGLFAGAPVAAASVAKAVTPPDLKPEFYVGQIREVTSHYESVPGYTNWQGAHFHGAGAHTHTLSIPQLPSHLHPGSFGYAAQAVSRYEQWNGAEWLPIDKPADATPTQQTDRT
jgi:hypothetical protein